MAENKEDAEKLLFQYEQHKAQIEALQEGINFIDSSLIQMDATIETLNGAGAMGKKNEVLLPVGADSFLSANITDTKYAIVGIGGGVAVKKTIKEAVVEIEERKIELEKIREERAKTLEKIIRAAQEMAPRVQELMSKTQEEG
jgi:prefoldin alpha subunit